MDNQTVIITGASTGIGKAITRLFLQKGSNVIMNSSSQENLEKAHAEFGSPNNAILVAGDISRKEVGDRLVKTAVDKYGSVDVLINNAGLFEPKPFLDVEDSDFHYYPISIGQYALALFHSYLDTRNEEKKAHFLRIADWFVANGAV